MTGSVNVLLVETDELEMHERVEQLLMDGYAVDAVAAADQARVRLADGPDALILCGEPQTIGALPQGPVSTANLGGGQRSLGCARC